VNLLSLSLGILRIMERHVSLMNKNPLIYASTDLNSLENNRAVAQSVGFYGAASSNHDNERELFLKGIHNVYRVYEFLRAIQATSIVLFSASRCTRCGTYGCRAFFLVFSHFPQLFLTASYSFVIQRA